MRYNSDVSESGHDLLTSIEVAEMLRVHRATVLRWAREGRIRALPLPGRGVRFRRSDVERILADTPEVAAS